jgi:hypothetical protein
VVVRVFGLLVNAIMGWTVFQPRREQCTRQRYESLRSRPQLENGAIESHFIIVFQYIIEILSMGNFPPLAALPHVIL